MNYKEISKGLISAVIVIASFVLLCWGLWLIRSVLAYIFIAFAISLMGRPLMNFINEKLHFSKTISALFTMLSFGLIFVLLATLLAPRIIEQASKLSLLNVHQLQETIQNQISVIENYFKEKNIYFLNEDYSRFLTPKFTIKINTIQNGFSILTNIAISIFSISFITFFFLREKELFNQMILSIVPSKDEKKAVVVISNIKNLLTRYFLGLTLQVFSMFSLYIIILLSFKIDNAILIAVICAFLNLIPYMGPLLGFFIFTLFGLSSMFIEGGGDFNTDILTKVFWLAGFYIIAQIIDNIVFQPLIYAKSVKSHPLEIFIVMLIAGILFGVLGVIFAVPGYTVLRVILKNFFNKFKIIQSITKNI